MPKLGDTLRSKDESAEVLRFLSQRRSSLAKVMQGDDSGPSGAQLAQILELSARVPDHRKLAPFRFVTFRGQARADFGDILEARYRIVEPGKQAHHYEYESARFLRAHTVIAVISAPKACPKGTPEWEQVLSSGAACFQMLLAARAMGFAAQWLSEWYSYDAGIAQALGMQAKDKIAGFVYISSASEPPKERARPDVSALTTEWSA